MHAVGFLIVINREEARKALQTKDSLTSLLDPRSLRFLVGVGALLATSHGQQALPEKLMTFDAASVKVNTGETNQTPGRRKGPPPLTIDPSRLAVRRLTLKGIISRAYGVEDAQVTGGPGWIEEDRYDIDATVAQSTDREHMLAKLQALLSERFHLRLRKESKAKQRYVLVVGKNGPNYGPHFHASEAAAPGAKPTSSDGLKGYTMPRLAFFLTDNRDWWDPNAVNGLSSNALPVIDETGLTGAYDLVWSNKSRRDWLDSFEHDTGLRLEPRKIPTQMIVVESASKPTPN